MTDFRPLAKAEYIERMRFQFLLADRLLLALLVLNAGAWVLREGHGGFTAGIVVALLSYVGGFLSQHFYSIACFHEYAQSGQHRLWIKRGHVFYFGGIACALLSIIFFAAGIRAA